MRKALFLMASLIMAAGCEKGGNCFRSAGTEKSLLWTDSAHIETLTLENDLYLTWHPQGEGRVEFRGGENLLSLMKAELTDNHLRLWEKNTCRWMGKYDDTLRAEVHSSGIREITMLGRGNLRSADTVKNEFLKIIHYFSAGDVYLKVRTRELFIYQHSGVSNHYISGKTRLIGISAYDRGIYNLKDLTARNAAIDSRGTGEIRLTVTDTLSVFSTGVGDIHIWGNPVVKSSEIKGKGKLILH